MPCGMNIDVCAVSAAAREGVQQPMSRCPWHLYVLLLLVCFASQALAQSVSIISPSNNQIVRGVVKVKISKPDAESGWVAYKLDGPSQKDEYVAAVAKPFVFPWNTLARDIDGKAQYPDGTYTIKATAMSPSSQVLGQTSVTVTLSNNLGYGEAPSSVKLRLNYKRGHDYTYTMDGKRTVNVKRIPLLGDLTGKFDATLRGLYVDHTMTTSSGGPAIIRKRFVQGITVTPDKTANISGVGQTYTLVYMPNGDIRAKHKEDKECEPCELILQLPDQAVRVGDSWPSDMWILVDPLMSTRTKVRGIHKLDGFQWLNGHKVARIISTYQQKGFHQSFTFNGMPMTVSSDYKGTRYSYFAYTEGRFIGTEDIIDHDYTANLSSGYGTMGAQGMPMAPGMEIPGMPGMPPGMGAVPPGAPGMGGLPPGAPGMGMPGMGFPGGAPEAVPGMGGIPGMGGGIPGMGGAVPGMGMMPGMGGGVQIPQTIKGTGKVTMTVMEKD